MSIATEIAAIQAINAAIAGITSAPEKRPASVPHANRPCILMRPGPLNVGPDTRDGASYSRRYEGICIVDGKDQGLGIEQSIDTCQELMDRLSDVWSEQLTASQALQSAVYVTGYTDSGEGAESIQYGDGSYVGFTFTITIERY